MHLPQTHCAVAHDAFPSGHALQMCGTRQSPAEVHSTPVAPPELVQPPEPVEAPPAPPVPGGHDGNDATHVPFTHVSLGHALLPSGQSLHGAPIAGQSPSDTHCGAPPAPPLPPVPDGHAGKDVSHWPFTQAAVAQLALPSEHSLQICGTAH
jgi:hypothetical protein